MTSTTATPESTLALPRVRRLHWQAVAAAFLVTVAAAFAIAAGFVIGLAQAYEGRVMPGVRVGGVELAGLDRPAAEARLRQALPTLASGELEFVLDGKSLSLPLAALGREYELQASLDQAYAVGRSGNLAERTLDGARSLLRGTTLEPTVRYDQARLTALVDQSLAEFDVPAVDATAGLAKDGFWFTSTEAQDGRRVLRSPVYAAAQEAAASVQSRGSRIELTTEVVEPAVGTQEARAAALQAQSMTIHPLVLVVGDDEHLVPARTLKTWIAFGQASDGRGYVPSVVGAKVRTGVKKLVPNIDRAPANAGFVARDGRVVKVIPSRDGRKLDVAASTARISEALAAITPTSPRPRVDLVVTATAPALTTEQAEAYAPKMRRLSTHTTVYTPSEKNFFGRNISIPTSIIDGYVVAPGEWFDFWVVVGEVSRARGFGPGGAIINGRTEPTGALAGGICSCSTTLFNAALKAGLELGARRNHYYYINRYPLGLDATVFKSSSGSTQTMSFRNDTPYPVLIRGINATGSVTFQIYSVPNGRKVTVGAPRTANFRPARDSVVYTDTLSAGVRKRVEYPVDGLDVWRTWTVRDASGKVIHQKTFYSHYARITGIVLVGRGATDTNDATGGASGG